MNNAGIGAKGTSWDGLENWRKVFEVNLFGCVVLAWRAGLFWVLILGGPMGCVCV
jgi:NAD(P)-dependent dehydrogenase (short-subunit alcohol dehydrogenase family)